MNKLRKQLYALLLALVCTSALLLGGITLGQAQTPSSTQIQTQVVEYQQGDAVLEGYLAYDASRNDQRPGVLIIHAWKGLGEFEKEQADKLAQMGYVAFAADIYGQGIRPETTDEAREQATYYRSNRGLLRDRAQAGLDYLKQHRLTNSKQTAAIGYCFGGTTVLELARSGAQVSGVVSFHGGLDTPNPDDAQQITAKVLALHGADDPLVPPEEVAAFQEEMRQAGVDWQLIAYGGTVHSFTNPKAGNDPSKGSAYNPDSARRSFAAMELFFDELFQ
ncbi:dienelactone hydrolase family protein [Roseofilum capinflatum]|uniref:Dienelactone hydrolase family protein n=1 Tax=Roseofilum capinflatum BLCC-M114 TaxID=3022440 RepID=A0ABT7B360_9CYAN|nr:dienelactone hydrolase family protein [Roseofilum capinflatum]MDJ1173610.1 dienelactone hydrolase family protein [Roseofilum capinflatum BLCC-M114]